MSFYDEVRARNAVIPEEYDLTVSQLQDFYHNAPGKFELMAVCFEYGFEQGRASKEAENVTIAPAKVELMKAALDKCPVRELQLVYTFMHGLGVIEGVV